jgi:hypothetical protein
MMMRLDGMARLRKTEQNVKTAADGASGSCWMYIDNASGYRCLRLAVLLRVAQAPVCNHVYDRKRGCRECVAVFVSDTGV